MIHQQYLRKSIRQAEMADFVADRQTARYGWKCQRGGETGKSDDLCSLCSNHNLFGPPERRCRYGRIAAGQNYPKHKILSKLLPQLL